MRSAVEGGTLVERKKVEIRVRDCPLKAVDEFRKFQGKLKRISRDDLDRLKESIKKNGFNAPIFLWSGHDYILDGHQRLAAVYEMRSEGWECEGLPYVDIEADNEDQAREMVLAFNSQYGEVTKRGLESFLGERFDRDLEELARMVKIPGLDLGKLDRELKEALGEVPPEIEFATELDENHQYVVLYFKNEMDWMHALTVLGLKQVRPLHAKPGFTTQGIGRVVDGVEAMKRIRGQGDE